MKSENRKF